MTSLVLVDRAGRQWLTLSWSRAVVWASMLLPVLVAIGALIGAAPATPVWPAAFVLLLALTTGAIPDSSAGSTLLIGYLAWWIWAVREPAIGWALLAAVALLAFHAAVALASAGPPGATTEPVVRRRLAVRLLWISLATAGVAAVAALAAGAMVAPAAVVALVLLMVGALPILVESRRNPSVDRGRVR